MFLGPDRLPVVRRMILADTPAEEDAALAELGRVQQADFEEILDAMDGLPVTVRLLDPPLHEFLPSVEELRSSRPPSGLDDEERRCSTPPGAGGSTTRCSAPAGVRLGIVKPGLYRMQVRALLDAAVALRRRGEPDRRDHDPAHGDPRRAGARPRLGRGGVAAAIEGPAARSPDITIGTMIETPRAALRAGEIAAEADFFCFGTNDLTQMTFGFSRDDVEGRIMRPYLEQGLLPRNPFETIDADGVGELVRIGTERGRRAKPDLKVGVCGEHGGDPESIAVFYAPGSTTSPARRTGCRSPGWRPRRPSSGAARPTRSDPSRRRPVHGVAGPAVAIHDEDVARLRPTAIVAVVSRYVQLRKVGRRWSGCARSTARRRRRSR